MTAGVDDPTAAFRLDGKVAVVTGASSGLGRQFARTLAGVGAHVVLVARRADRLEKLADEIGTATAVACDLAEPSDRARVVEAAIEVNGRLDVLVNNAGITRIGPALEESDDDFAHVVAVNLTAAFSLARQAAAAMVTTPEGGAIVNVASVLGMVGVGQVPQGGYAAAKGGLINLTRELAAQWARRGVRVNALAPGWFRTEMTAEMYEDARSMEWVARKTPMGRGGELHELDGALLLLATPAGSYITGQVVAVDGGWTAV